MKMQTKLVYSFYFFIAFSLLSLFSMRSLSLNHEFSNKISLTNQCVAPNHKILFHICYFSLNNEHEFTEMEHFTNKINKHTSQALSIQEYLTEGDNPEESFKKMVESDVHCDGLVISGHHTGAFGGKRSSGSLSIDFLEQLSCNPKYQNWFSQVNALWLMGCRTLGTGEIVSNEEENSADYHTQRVGAVLREDHLEQSIADLNIEFSATLDQDNPLSSRYLRIFPEATVFGWTKSAPEEQAGSQYSIPFHIAHISKLMNDPPVFPKDSPLKSRWNEKSTTQYLNSITGVLSGKTDLTCQQKAVQAWKDHGKVQNQKREYGFYNPDLNAYTPLATHDAILTEVRLLSCLLKNTEGETFRQTLDEVLKNPTFIRYTYNTLLERLKHLNKTDPLFYAQTVEYLKTHPVLFDFISKKLSDQNIGILRKIDYLAFYEQIYGPSETVRSALLNRVQEHYINTPSSTIDELDYKVTLIYSLTKHGYLRDPIGWQLFSQIFYSPNAFLRRHAIRLVDWIGGEKALFLLKEGVLDESPFIRKEIMLALGRMKSWKSSYLLSGSDIWTIEEVNETNKTKEHATWIAQREKYKQQILFIINKGLDDKVPMVRADAKWAMDQLWQEPSLEKESYDPIIATYTIDSTNIR